MRDTLQTAGVLIIEDNKVLLVKHTKKASLSTNSYGLPAGRLEENETHIECALRELTEETNYTAVKEDLVKLLTLYVADIERGGKVIRIEYIVFLCKRYQGELKGGMESIPEWVDINKLNELYLLPNVENIIKEGMEIIK